MEKRNRCKGEPKMMDKKMLRDDGGEIAERCDVKIGIGDGLMMDG